MWVVIAALILGTSVVGASFVIRSSVDRVTGELASMRTAIGAVPNAPGAEPAARARVTPTMDKLVSEYGDQVRIVFKNLPLSIHPKAQAAHAAAEAAHRQGNFWGMHDRIFANQRNLEPEVFEGYAEAMGLDMDRYRADVASSDVKKRIGDDMVEAQKLGVSGTPGFFVNGRFVSGAQPFETFKRLVDEELGKG
jgi:protein-disulfide isomerase